MFIYLHNTYMYDFTFLWKGGNICIFILEYIYFFLHIYKDILNWLVCIARPLSHSNSKPGETNKTILLG